MGVVRVAELAPRAVAKLSGLSTTDREMLVEAVEKKLMPRWSKLSRWDPDEQEGYAFRVAKNTAIDLVWNRPVVERLPDDPYDTHRQLNDPGRDAEDDVDNRDLAVWAAAKLSLWLKNGDDNVARDITAWKLYVVGRHFEGGGVEPMSTDAISANLGICVGTVNRAIARISFRLANELGEDPPPPRRPGPRGPRRGRGAA